MYSVAFAVFHSGPDFYDRDKYVAEFNSLSDALTWCGFYHNKAEDPDSEGYYRDWHVRGVWYTPAQMKSPATIRPSDIPAGFIPCGVSFKYDSTDYLTSDMTWDQIDSLPVNDIDQTIH